MRPYAWLWFDTLPITVLYFLLEPAQPSFARLTKTVVMFICLDAGATTLNDVFDIESDRRSKESNRRERPLVTGVVSRPAALLQGALLMLAAVVLSIWIGGLMPLTGGLTILLGIAYSTPPMRFNARPWSSQPFWLVFGASLYLTVATAAEQLYTPQALLWLLGYYGFFAIGENLAKDIRDWDNDRAGGKVTLVVKFGPHRAALGSLVGAIFGTLAYTLMCSFSSQIGTWASLISTGILMNWLFRVTHLVRTLRTTYDKPAARELHLGYIRTFLWLHLIWLSGMSFSLREFA
ncbi:MAG: UbiA family prenyltransferase [Myxococcota bacterium]